MKSPINNEAGVLDYLSAVDVESAKKNVYKYTDCGAWIAFIDGGIKLGSIVEGSDAECETHTLMYPFDGNDYDAAIQVIEEEASLLWNEANPV